MSGFSGSPREMVDTNILIYAHDPTDKVKQDRAVRLIEELIGRGALTISTQVLNEFYAAATRRGRPPSLPHQIACEIVRDLITVATVLPLASSTTLMALEAVAQHQFSFWDALIWAAAREHDIQVIYTEDAPGSDSIDGVRYINPLATVP